MWTADAELQQAARRRRLLADAQPVRPHAHRRALLRQRGSARCGRGGARSAATSDPRLNRLHGAYPLVRAATCVLMRDLSVNLTIMDIMRGSPAIYVMLRGLRRGGPSFWPVDRRRLRRARPLRPGSIARVHRVIEEKAPRPYELLRPLRPRSVLRGHLPPALRGDLKEFIEQQLPEGDGVAQSMGGDTGRDHALAALGARSRTSQQQRTGGGLAGRSPGRVRTSWRRALRATDRGAAAPAQVTAYGSGNLAQVYFDLYPAGSS